MTERGLGAAVAASRRWYDDLFCLHRVPVKTDGVLWWAEGAPPRWHSAVKTLVPTSDPTHAVRRMERHSHGTIADSFGLLDTVGVLPADLWAHPRFTVLARRDGDVLTGGAILHDAGTVVGLSNTWSIGAVPLDPGELLDLAAATHRGRAVVDYAWGADLQPMPGAGFEPVGPHRVWIR